MSLQAMLFDVDGTLADTERDGHRVAFNQAFDEAGLDWDWSVPLYGDLLSVTGGKERIRYFLRKYMPEFAPPGDDLDDFIADLHRRKTSHYLKLLQQGEIPLRPGVARLLQEARLEGIRLGIATTTTPANVEMLLRTTLGPDSLNWFEVIAAGDIVPAKKPAPDIFQYALQEMDIEAENCLAFEDSENGLASSMGAGCRTLVTVNEYTRNQDFSGAWTVLEHLGEPGQPAKCLQGVPIGSGIVTVEALKNAW